MEFGKESGGAGGGETVSTVAVGVLVGDSRRSFSEGGMEAWTGPAGELRRPLRHGGCWGRHHRGKNGGKDGANRKRGGSARGRRCWLVRG